jgi:hypothetical protein
MRCYGKKIRIKKKKTETIGEYCSKREGVEPRRETIPPHPTLPWKGENGNEERKKKSRGGAGGR